ncbi:MAG: efflux RND transporter permease subunit [Methylocystaceae bacterium]
MKLVNLSVKRPVTMIIMVSLVLILGFFTLSKLGLDLYPNMKLPYAAVITSYPGAGPEEVESQVSKPMESIISTISNVKNVQTISSSGSSMVLIEFNWGTNMDNATIDIREKISMIEKALPAEMEKPMVVKMDPTMMPILQIGVRGGDNLSQLQSLAEDMIKPRLARIPGVASVVVTGGKQREVKVQVDPVKLQDYGLSLSQVTGVLRSENFNQASGTVKQGEREYFLRNLQQFESVDDIRNVAITTARGNTVYLKDIATIIDGYKDNTQITRVDGTYAVGIHILKQTDANTVSTCMAVKKELDAIAKDTTTNIQYKVVFDQSQFINESLDNTKRLIYEGALLAMLVLFLFLRNLRSTFIIFTSIPISIIATFVLLYFTKNSLNLITLSGLALGVGRIVDDSIVVFENIYRHRANGLLPMDAAIKGASEVGSAVMASTFTIMAVFLPMVFVEGIAAILFKPLAITISFAILCSLGVSLTVIPLMSSRLLTDASMNKSRNKNGRIFGLVNRFGLWLDNLGERYKNLLSWSLTHRKMVVITVTILMIASIVVSPLVGAEFMSKMDSGEISISLEMDKGTSIANTEQYTTDMEQQLRKIPEISTIFTSVGGNANMMLDTGTQSNKSTVYVKLTPLDQREKSVDTIAEEIRERVRNIAGAKINVSVMDNMGMGDSGAPINVQIKGDDMDVLKMLSNEVSDIVRKVPGTREVTSTLTDGNPEVQVKVDRMRAASYGLTPVQIASEIKNAMEGSVATRYKSQGDEIDVRVRYNPEAQQNLEYLTNLSILSPSGMLVQLSQVATFEIAQGPVQITRLNQTRLAEVNAYLLNRDLKNVMADIQEKVSVMNLPQGYTIEYGGQNKEMMDSFTSLAMALLLAIILVYAVMAVQYESFFNPFVIMFSVPTAFIGVTFSLLLTGRTFNVVSFIGVIMLVGIVVANAIVLVDYLKRLRDQGMERNAAIIEAGRVRLRPILMTAMATILAMVPLALGIGSGGETQAPLATVVIGGLLVSTVITLVLVPVVYSIFDDWGRKIKAKRQYRRNMKSEGAAV